MRYQQLALDRKKANKKNRKAKGKGHKEEPFVTFLRTL
jgi:hypothetical protein